MNDVEDFMTFHRYTDERTFTLIGAASKVLNLSLEVVLEAFGEYFFEYCLQCGYDKMLRTLGDDLVSFIQNLDSLHAMLAMSYKNITAPSFRCETDPDGTMMLHYYSSRPGLHPIVKGLVPAVGRKLFSTKTEMELVSVGTEQTSPTTKLEHAVFKVHIIQKSREGARLSIFSSSGMAINVKPSFPDTNLLSPKYICNLFPYHIIFDQSLRVLQAGSAVQCLYPKLGLDITLLTDIFNLAQPKIALTFENVRKFQQQVYVLNLNSAIDKTVKEGIDKTLKKEDNKLTVERAKPAFASKGDAAIAIVRSSTQIGVFSLKGQMVYIDNINCMLFICSPRLSSLSEMEEKGIFLSDIPLYDVTRELVLLNQQRIAEIEISKQLDETTAQLTRTSKALDVEKKKTETLLYQMLPKKVADKLKVNEKVDAEKFESVTILFSDIVTFTNIASECTPIQVVDMLNELYLRFDNATEKHEVYKVETIGDAYMVVSGVPTKVKDHALRVAKFSLDMVRESSQIKSPVTGRDLQIRVGVHTGPVVAGVVGLKMPRYCLFGDTVNTASRMESHSLPGRIHVSPVTYEAIKSVPGEESNCHFEYRGGIEIKGKGHMKTYFLLSIGSEKSGSICNNHIPTTSNKLKVNQFVQNKSNSSICGVM